MMLAFIAAFVIRFFAFFRIPSRHRPREEWPTTTWARSEIAAKLGINKNTALKWHRFLKALAEAPPPLLSGIVEVDEAFIQPSNKGQKIGPSFKPEGSRGTAGMVPVLVARARFEQTTPTQVMPHCDTAAIDAALSPLLRCDAILCTDGAAMYPLIAKRLGIEHHPVINPTS